MLSLISASASDFGILFDYLPSHIPGRFKKFYNIMAGVSLGGHVAWRVSKSVGANKIHGIVPIIASPNLTGLMLSRLGVDASILKLTYRDLYTLPYRELATVLTEEQQRRWPESLSKIVQETDRAIEEDFPKDIPMLIQNGELDLLVPSEFATQWAQHTNPDPCKKIECFVQKNTGHTCTKEMVTNTADWLVRLFMI
jgi:esterase/lipase